MAVEIANSGKPIRFDTCDTFRGVAKSNFHKDQDYLDQEAARDEDGLLLTQAIKNLEPVSDHVNIRCIDSIAAAHSYADGSLDFVFLDNDHSAPHVLKELKAWWPKVKPGGVLAGHDINWPSVSKAVLPWSDMTGLQVHIQNMSWFLQKPDVKIPLRVANGKRRCLVALCTNERSIYRQTVGSLMQLGWGQRVTDAAKAHGFNDIQFTLINRFLLVSDLRNEAVRIARAQQCTHILFLDADMTWPSDVLSRMLRHHDKGIVSGLYFLKTWPHWPVALTRGRVNLETQAVDYDYDKSVFAEEGLVPQQAVGMGCALVPMSIFDAMPDPWFEYRQDNDGRWTVTEDMPFCQKAAGLGVPILVDPSVKCGHVSQHPISEPWYERSLIEMHRLAEMQEQAEKEEQAEKVPA
jgi:SAM-dependent methyltransferase